MEACTHVEETRMNDVADVLAERCVNACTLVETYLKRVREG